MYFFFWIFYKNGLLPDFLKTVSDYNLYNYNKNVSKYI